MLIPSFQFIPLILCCLFFCRHSFSVLGSFPVSQLFASGGQIPGASASVLVLPVNIQDWFPLGLMEWREGGIYCAKGVCVLLVQQASVKSYLTAAQYFRIWLLDYILTMSQMHGVCFQKWLSFDTHYLWIFEEAFFFLPLCSSVSSPGPQAGRAFCPLSFIELALEPRFPSFRFTYAG